MAPVEAVVALAGIGMMSGAVFGVFRTVNKWLDRRHERLMARERGTLGGGELRDVRNRLDVLEDLGYRMQELEERLDFTERMLARQSKARLSGEGGL